MILRQGEPGDLPALYEICHKTGHSGADASAVISDRCLLGTYFAAPYLIRDPGWCWVAVDGEGVAGYLVTTPDTRAFVAWMNAEWLPAARTRFPERDKLGWSDTEMRLRDTLHRPAGFPDFVDEYPAHFHIDFLPRAQGQGLGTKILRLFQEKLKAERVKGFHLGVSTANAGALAFYAKQKFSVIREDPGVNYLGLAL